MAASVAFTVSFLLCGLWHDLSLRYLAWGGLHAVGRMICNVYKQSLLRHLGRKGVNRYLANPWIKAAAIALTFEYVAFSLAAATYPFEDLFTWTDYPG